MANFTSLRGPVALIALLVVPASAKVFLRWTELDAPPAQRVRVKRLVVPWEANRIDAMKELAQQGYEVYAEASPEEAPDAAAALAKNSFAGVLVKPENTTGNQGQALRKLRYLYPKLSFRVLNPNGKQPQMRSRLVINRNGVLQVTSSTAQPWIDTNLALVKLERASHPKEVPLYSFQWESERNAEQPAPSADDFALALAEAAAFDADLLLPIPEKLQRDLNDNDERAWNTWNAAKRVLDFASKYEQRRSAATNVGVVPAAGGASFEPMNLLARHNIQYRILSPKEVIAPSLTDLYVLLLFVPPDEQMTRAIANFTSRGGAAVLIDSHGSYPWQSGRSVRNAQNSVTYEVGKGRAIELSEPVTDPESFAQDVRRLIDNQKIQISLWNALTTVAVLYHSTRPGEETIELLNYAEEPLRVPVRVKGSFAAVRYESPEHACCERLKPTLQKGFTEFVIPGLEIAGRVYLGARPAHVAAQR